MYDKAKLIADVRMMLGGICEDVLPSSVIIFYGDCHDNNPEYTGDYPYIWFKTTIDCIDWLIRKAILDGAGSKTSDERTEKVGDVSVTVKSTNSSDDTVIDNYQKLKEMFLKDPTCFGITPDSNGYIFIAGNSKSTYYELKSDKDAKGMWDELDPLGYERSRKDRLNRI